jgi:hypothetical protein
MDWTHNIKLFEEDIMARQQKKEVTVNRLPHPSYTYKAQWSVSASPTANHPAPNPYTVSEAKDGNWSCSCMNWTRTHPREDCKHIMRVKLRENTPVEIKVNPKMQFVQSTGRIFRDA